MNIEETRKNLKISRSWLGEMIRGNNRAYKRDTTYNKDAKEVELLLRSIEYTVKKISKKKKL